MKIKELCETTAGAIASVANPVGSVIKRNMKNPKTNRMVNPQKPSEGDFQQNPSTFALVNL